MVWKNEKRNIGTDNMEALFNRGWIGVFLPVLILKHGQIKHYKKLVPCKGTQKPVFSTERNQKNNNKKWRSYKSLCLGLR